MVVIKVILVNPHGKQSEDIKFIVSNFMIF